MYLIGAESQTASTETYSNSNVYMSNGDLTANNFIGAGTVEYIRGTQSSATNHWVGTSKRSALANGDIIAYYLPQDSLADVDLNLTLANSTTTGAKAVYRYG